ncbi:hypothetical protein BgiMline_021544 [Biomphalaria glabrata]|nr:dnaJ-like protein subfamily B member 6-like; partial [Biomphalaria glabrata]
MSGDVKKDLRAEARNFSATLANASLLKRKDPQSKSLLEKAQQIIDALLADCSKPMPATPPPRPPRGGTGMGQLWVKLDELKRENDDLKRQRTRSTEEKVGSPKSPKSPKFHAPVPGQFEAVSAELQRVKLENEALKVHIEKLQLTIKEHQTVNSNLRDDCKRSKAALEAAQKSAMKAREETKKMESNFQAVKTENDSLKQKLSQNHPTPPPRPSTTKPSSANAASKPSPANPTQKPTPAHATSKPTPSNASKPSPENTTPKQSPATSSPKPRMRTDNRLTENISEKCRPSNIAVAYTTLESQEWMDAKESLEELEEDEHQITQFLCGILMSSYEVSTLVLQSVERVIGYILTNPTSAVTIMPEVQVCPLPAEVADVIGQRLRMTFDKVNAADISELAKQHFSSTSNSISSMWSSHHAVQKYIHQCALVTWQMAIQKPPMKLHTADARFDSSRHNLWWSCDQSRAKTIDYFIWPVLYDYEGGNLMVKGCVHAT